jgi:N-acetyl-gamma-glutamylphosphate reductase
MTKNRPTWRRALVGLALIAAIALMAACGSGSKTKASTPAKAEDAGVYFAAYGVCRHEHGIEMCQCLSEGIAKRPDASQLNLALLFDVNTGYAWWMELNFDCGVKSGD